MPTKSEIQTAIDSKIIVNTNGEITATILQEILTDINENTGSDYHLFIQYSSDNSAWSDSLTNGDKYIRLAIAETKPANNADAWSAGLEILNQPDIDPTLELFIQYSDDNSTWRDNHVDGDEWVRFAVAATKPSNNSDSWSVGIDLNHGIPDELTDAQIGSKAFKNPPNLNNTEQLAVTTAIGAATKRQAHLGIFELNGHTDRDVQDTLHFNEANDSTSVSAGDKYFVVGGTEGGLKGKLIRRTSEALGNVTEDDFSTNFSTYWETILLTDRVKLTGNSYILPSEGVQILTSDDYESVLIGALESTAELPPATVNDIGKKIYLYVFEQPCHISVRDGDTLLVGTASFNHSSSYTFSTVGEWIELIVYDRGLWSISNRFLAGEIGDLKTALNNKDIQDVSFNDDGEVVLTLNDNNEIKSDRDTKALRVIGTHDQTQVYKKNDVVDNNANTPTKWYVARKKVPANTALTSAEHWGDITGTVGGTGGAIADGSITTAKLANDAVTDDKISNTTLAKIDGALQKTGGTMTGKIVLDGAPTADLHPATKKYVDDLGGEDGEDGQNAKWLIYLYLANTSSTTPDAPENVKYDYVNDLFNLDNVANWGEDFTRYHPESVPYLWRAEYWVDPDSYTNGAVIPQSDWVVHSMARPGSVADGAVTTAKIANNAVTTDKLAFLAAINILAVPQWSTLSGTIPKGFVCEHNDFYFISRLEHTKQATGPDGDPANWWDLGEWWGVLSTQKYYPEGATGKTGAGNTLKIWRASEFIHSSDPLPTASGNVKWKQIWPPHDAPVGLSDEQQAAWRTAIGTAEVRDARKERIKFSVTARVDDADGNPTRPRFIDFSPLATDPIEVISGDGDPEFITNPRSNSDDTDFTFESNVYLLYWNGSIITSATHSKVQIELVDDSDGTTVLAQSSTTYLRGNNKTFELSKFMVLSLSSDTAVRLRLRNVEGDFKANASSLSAVRLTGDPTQVGVLEGQVSDLETEVSDLQEDVSANTASIRTGVANAEKFASDLIANLVFGDAGSVDDWPEDSPPGDNAPQRMFVSEKLSSTYTVPAANTKATTDQSLTINHEPGLYELTTGTAINQIEIEVGKKNAVDGGSDVDYGASQRLFDWHKDQHFRHVPSVGKVLHSPLGSGVSGFVELTNGSSHDSYAMLLEESLWQAWTTFGNRTFFAHMNRTKQDGTVLHQAVELGGNDPVIQSNGVSYRVFSPFAPIPSAAQHFLRNAYEENQGDTAEAIAARKVSIYFNATANDTTTRFFLGNSLKGYTLVETEYGVERPVLSPTVRHLVRLSESAYNNLATKDSDTIYVVEGVGIYAGENLLGSPSEDVLLWEHTAQSSDWHPSGEQLGSGVSTAIYNGIGGDNPWSRIEAEIKWTETRNSVGHEHVGIIVFPGWRKGTILPARPLRLHGQGRIGGEQNTSTMNAVLKLVARNDEMTNPSHLFIEGFNTPGDTGIGSNTQITVKLWGVR